MSIIATANPSLLSLCSPCPEKRRTVSKDFSRAFRLSDVRTRNTSLWPPRPKGSVWTYSQSLSFPTSAPSRMRRDYSAYRQKEGLVVVVNITAFESQQRKIIFPNGPAGRSHLSATRFYGARTDEQG